MTGVLQGRTGAALVRAVVLSGGVELLLLRRGVESLDPDAGWEGEQAEAVRGS